MQIVINIDDEDYKRIQDIPDVFNSLTSRTYSAIRNGTPLPKGHGKIIDVAEYFKKEFGDAREFLDNATTIIEADKAESEDE